MPSPDLVAVAHHAMALAPSPFLPYQKTARHQVREGVAFTKQDAPGGGFNFAAVLGPAPSLDRVVQLGQEFFGERPGGWGVLVEGDAGHPVEAELRGRGWDVLEDEPALVLPRLEPVPAAPASLEVRHVTDPAGLRTLYEKLAEAFDTPLEVLEPMIPHPSIALDPAFAFLAGYCDGQPVCGAIFARIGDIATIHGVSTLPAYRRRGFGAAITWAAIAEGQARGCTRAALRAMGISYEMYQKMGFVPVCRHRTYVPAKKA